MSCFNQISLATVCILMGVFLWIEMSPALSGGFKATNGYKINNDLEGYQDSLDILQV